MPAARLRSFRDVRVASAIPQRQRKQLATSWAVAVYARPASVGLPDFKLLFGAQCGSIRRLIYGKLWPLPYSGHASKHFYFPSAHPAIFRRASGSGRSAWLAIGKGSRSLFSLHTVGSGA